MLVALLVLNDTNMPVYELNNCLLYFQAPCLGAEGCRTLQASVSLSTCPIDSKTSTSCSCRKGWSGTARSWVNSSSYEIQRFSRQYRAGCRAQTGVCTQRDNAESWSRNSEKRSQVCARQITVIDKEVMMGLPWATTLAQGTMGLEDEKVKLWKTVKGVTKH